MRYLDLNCDLGEGGAHDAALMPLVTSANIACGAHAGDPATMRATVALAHRHGVAVGVHPGFADRENFGRRELRLAPQATGGLIIDQIHRFCEATRGDFHHVKLHGALYNLAARDGELAMEVALAVQTMSRDPLLYAPWGSELAKAAKLIELKVASEVFADRAYAPDGTLVPRGRPGALLGAELAVAQVLGLVRTGAVCATDGSLVPVQADTVCVHGDGPDAVAIARALRAALSREGVELRAFSA